MSRINLLSMFLLASVFVSGFSLVYAQSDGDPGTCDPLIQNCGPQCPPELPDCDGGAPAIDPEIQALMDIAAVCHRGDIRRRELVRMQIILIVKVILDIIEPQPARQLFKNLQKCV